VYKLLTRYLDKRQTLPNDPSVGKGIAMPETKREETKREKDEEIVFEGVVIPRGTRSAKLAAQGITTSDEMGNFLTAIFADTLNGKIILPAPESPNRLSSTMLKGFEHKLSRGLPMKIHAMEPNIKRKHKSKTKQPKEHVLKQN
jgi:hypothetical protein